MAAFNRPTNATYTVHENVTVDTQDNEDHTFCGIMFPVKCKELLPIDHLVIKSVSVRGRLGPLTVWVSNNEETVIPATPVISDSTASRRSSRRRNNNNVRDPSNNRMRVERNAENNRIENSIDLHPSAWTKLYDKSHSASRREYVELVLDQPIRIKPGETRVLYIHSTLPGDEAIVYDNSYYGTSSKRLEDDKLAIMTGRAHVSTRVFGQEPIWGWGNAWRDRREFVGRLSYGTVYKLWNPEVHPKFGGRFQDGARALLMCQRHCESPWSILPDECVYYILNMCRWDWFNDCSDSMKDRRRMERAKQKQQRDLALQLEQVAAATTEIAATDDHSMEDSKPSANESCCARVTRSQTRAAHDDVELGDEDAEEEEEEELDEEMDEEEMEVDGEEDNDDEEEDDGDDSDDWSDNEDQYHTANRRQFSFYHVDSDDEDDQTNRGESAENQRRDWIRRQFARIHVLRALASMEDQAVDAMES
ncbi:hypothetical protein IV203_037660 [Nitzschia inconspicua]|uniref:Uncharacterized protein n=1 Tax=Nitzschia inconspicua TaxID=303405 RepID=A0A9K3LMK3_9STRA|nr:hypothetical protein IV203_037660 [Nitzschia inconspicua]